MRIAIVTELFLPSLGGQEVRFAELSRALVRRGHSVDVFCIQNVPGSAKEEITENVKVHRYPEALNYQKTALKFFRRRLSPLLRYALWCRRIPAGNFDFFLFNEWPLAHILLAPRSILSRAAIDWCEYRNGVLLSFAQAYLPRLASRNIANSAALKARLQVVSGRRFKLLPSGIFPDQYQSAPRSERQGILYLGRIAEHKNLPLLLSSFESLLGKGYAGSLRIAGNGPGLPALYEWVKASTAADKIEVLGTVDEETKRRLLASSELLLLTSRREGFPRVMAEAMASGLPVVTADYVENGAKDLVLQYGIGEVAAATAGPLSDAVIRVLNNWSVYSMACIAASKSLDWEALVDDFLEIAESAQKQV